MTDAFEDFLEIEGLTQKERDKTKEKIFGEVEIVDAEDCNHDETVFVDEKEVCTTCGSVIKDDPEKDMKYQTERKHNLDINRCHKRKSDKRTIYKDVEGMDIPETIVKTADKSYQEIIKNNIYRGSKRKAIIVACIYHAYIFHGHYLTSGEIAGWFKIKTKNVKDGFAKYCECFPDASITYIGAKDLIRQIMIKTDINFSHMRRIYKLCDFLDNKSSLLNRSNPQSVAATIVYLYLCLEPDYKEKLGLSKVKFSKMVGLSDITITKLGKEFQKIIRNDDIKI